MRAYDSIKAERGREVNLETPDFLEHARQLLSRTLSVEIRMSGSSMRPAIEDGDIITVEPIGGDPVKAGDVILYQSRYDTAVIHRVVRIERSSSERGVITRGDAASISDGPVPLQRVMGRVRLLVREGEQMQVDRPRRQIALWFVGWLHRLRFWANR